MKIQKVSDYHAMSVAGADIIYNAAAPVLKQGGAFNLGLADAAITITGQASAYVTDATGSVTLTLAAGNYVISATSSTLNLVTPISLIEVK